MSEFQDELSNCEREPIHVPGQIQSHGFLIVVDYNYKISHCSDNISGLFPEDGTKLLGRSLQHIELLIGNNYSSGFIADLISSGTTNKSFEQINPYKITIKGDDYYLIIS